MKIALKYGGKYLSAELDGTVNANRDTLDSWETWTVEKDATGHVRLKSAHNFYLAAELGGGEQVHANRTIPGPWEHWTRVEFSPTHIALGTWDKLHYLHVGPDLRVDATATVPVTLDVEVVEADPVMGDLARLHVSGYDFVDPDGKVVFLKMATSFLAYKRFLEGQDIRPVLNELKDLGCNCIVLFGMVVGFPVGDWAKFKPQDYPAYYGQIKAFHALCAEYGLYVYWCVFADTQHIMPALPDQLNHYRMVVAELEQCPNSILRLVNEQNAHENGVERAAFSKPPTVPSTSMDYGEEYGGSRYPAPYWDFGDNHTPRSDPKNVKDLCQADNPNYLAREATVVGEPDKFGQDHYTGRTYRMSPRLAKEMAGTAIGTCAGICFHSTDGVYSELMSDPVKACAKAWFAMLKGV